jgi:hypothetical protein
MSRLPRTQSGPAQQQASGGHIAVAALLPAVVELPSFAFVRHEICRMLRRYDDEATFHETCSGGRDFQALEQRRLRAGRRFARGASQAQVAVEFGVSRQTASGAFLTGARR